MKKETFRAAIFDLDGTLVDSMWMWRDIDIEYLKRHGLVYEEGLQEKIEGMSFHETATYGRALSPRTRSRRFRRNGTKWLWSTTARRFR